MCDLCKKECDSECDNCSIEVCPKYGLIPKYPGSSIIFHRQGKEGDKSFEEVKGDK